MWACCVIKEVKILERTTTTTASNLSYSTESDQLVNYSKFDKPSGKLSGRMDSKSYSFNTVK